MTSTQRAPLFALAFSAWSPVVRRQLSLALVKLTIIISSSTEISCSLHPRKGIRYIVSSKENQRLNMKNNKLASLVVLALLEMPRWTTQSFTVVRPVKSHHPLRRTSQLHGLEPNSLTRDRSPDSEAATAAIPEVTELAVDAGKEGEELTETQTLLQKVKQAGTAGGECSSIYSSSTDDRFCFRNEPPHVPGECSNIPSRFCSSSVGIVARRRLNT